MRVVRLRPGEESKVIELARAFRGKAIPASAASALLTEPSNLLLAVYRIERPVAYCLSTRLVGLGGDTTTMLLRELEVIRTARRRGLGKIMLDELKNRCGREGIRRIIVHTNERDTPAMMLYRSVGGERLASDDVVFEIAINRKPSGIYEKHEFLMPGAL